MDQVTPLLAKPQGPSLDDLSPGGVVAHQLPFQLMFGRPCDRVLVLKPGGRTVTLRHDDVRRVIPAQNKLYPDSETAVSMLATLKGSTFDSACTLFAPSLTGSGSALPLLCGQRTLTACRSAQPWGFFAQHVKCAADKRHVSHEVFLFACRNLQWAELTQLWKDYVDELAACRVKADGDLSSPAGQRLQAAFKEAVGHLAQSAMPVVLLGTSSQ